MINKKGKRGDVPVTILVLGVVAICILAIISFFFSTLKVKSGFDIGLVREATLVQDKIILYQNLGYSNEEINDLLGITETASERYYSVSSDKISIKFNLPR